MKRRPLGYLNVDARTGDHTADLTVDGGAIVAVRTHSMQEAVVACKAAALELRHSTPVRLQQLNENRYLVVASDETVAQVDTDPNRVAIGHVRPQPGDRWGGVVNGPPSSGGVEIGGATPVEAIDLGLAKALELLWLFPEADGPDSANAYQLSGIEPELPGHRAAT